MAVTSLIQLPKSNIKIFKLTFAEGGVAYFK
jgi:hypothetical protein